MYIIISDFILELLSLYYDINIIIFAMTEYNKYMCFYRDILYLYRI